ncbi:hypothetical protein UPYG_G00024900 [Umbra pygmaea]|uniref:Ig-like domain-containing protein n=1 Tax=Umbra pygmaea TaxID=75934 RepID=A0ABD0XLL7_UMBPY
MWPNCCWSLASLPRSILAVLLICDVYGQDHVSDCHPEIRVKRNTVLKAKPGDKLQINCPVIGCPNSSSSPSSPVSPSSPSAFWEKIMYKSNNMIPVSRTAHIEIGWQDTNDGGISHLTFKSISRNDSGSYRCKYNDAIGHSIYVIVLEGLEKTTTNIRDSLPDGLWLPVYTFVVIVVFAIMVITISMLSTCGCKGFCPSLKSRKVEQSKSQHIAGSPRPDPRPHQDQLNPQAQPVLLHDCVYENTPVRSPVCTHLAMV